MPDVIRSGLSRALARQIRSSLRSGKYRRLKPLFGKLVDRDMYQMAGFMMSVKGTPSTYNKDLQEDKEPLFDCVDTVANSIRIAEGVIATLTVRLPNIVKGFFADMPIPQQINADKMRAALTDDMLATDLADYLVRKGVSLSVMH